MEEKKKTENSCEEKEMVEVEKLMEVLTKVELDLAYSSEKLVNLNALLMQLSAQETEHESMEDGKIDQTSLEFMEKALMFNLLSGVLESEVRELDNFMVSLQSGIADAKRGITSCRHLAEPYAMLEEKLCDSEESLKQTQYQSSELKSQSAKLQRTAQALSQGRYEIGEASLKGQLNTQIAGQRHILHLLEKSLARELDLEKKLAESRKSEDELKSRLRHAEQAVFHMEETARAAAATAATTATVPESPRVGPAPELSGSEERAKALEEKAKEWELRAGELEALAGSLRESLEAAETRVEGSELEVAELTGTNAELTDELSFLKGRVAGMEKKQGALEKQLREAEIQLQHARASSEAGQEQQNMLYTAIWDMETLIEELKSKVARAESRTEVAEENCIALSEANAQMAKEVGALRDRLEDLEACLDRAKTAELEFAERVGAGTKLVMDTVLRLATERERIREQVNTLTKENENFAKKLGFTVRDCSVGVESEEEDNEISSAFKNNASNSSCAQSTFETVKDSVGKSFQLDEESNDCAHNSKSVNSGNGVVSKLGDSMAVSAKYPNLKSVCLAIFVSLLSVTVMYFINQKPYLLP